MKKILTTIMAFVFVLSCLITSVTIAEEAVGEYKTKERDLLVALSIVSEEQVAKGTESNTVTRGEVADVLTVLSACSGELTGFLGYTDVEKTHINYNGISCATALGLMNGYGDGTFRPDDGITYDELATVLLRLTGYTAAFKDTDVDSFATAATLRFFNKAIGSITSDAIVNRVNLITIIYNAIHTDVMKQSAYGAKEAYSVAKGCTVLTENLKVYYSKGVISKNSFTALNKNLSPALTDCVEIDGIEYLKGNTRAEELLGYKVEFYWQKESSEAIENKLIYVSEKGLNEVLTIDAEDIAGPIDPSNITTVKYYDEKNSLKMETIPVSAEFLYNDFPAVPTAATMDIEVGSITFIDNGTGEGWSIVKVENYQVLAVESVDIANGTIYSKYDAVANLDYNPHELNKTVFFYDKNGIASDPAEVREWYVLSVKKDLDGKKVSVYMTVDEILGMVTGKSADEVSIDETAYKKASWIDVDAEPDCKLNIGQTYLFYRDRWGRIAAVRTINSADFAFAYLINVGISRGKDKVCQILIFDIDGNVVTRDVESRVNVDETVYNTTQDQKNVLDKYIGEVIRVKLNGNGKVVKVFTAGGNGSDFREIPVTDGCNYRTGILGKDYAIQGSTINFYVPNSGNLDKFKIIKGAYSLPEDYVKISSATNGYALNDKFVISVLIRRYDDDEAYYNTGTKTSFVRDAQPYMVEKVSTVWDEEEGEITQITAWHRGNKAVLPVYNDVVIKNISPVTGYYAAQTGEKIPPDYCATLKKGDLIRLNWDINARIRAIELVYSYNEDRTLDNIYVPDVNLAAAPNNGIVTPYKTVRGYIDEITDGFFRLFPATGDVSTIRETVYNLYPDTSGVVTVLDTKTGEIYKGNMSDALTYKVAGEDATRVVLYSTYGTLQAAYIYK